MINYKAKRYRSKKSIEKLLVKPVLESDCSYLLKENLGTDQSDISEIDFQISKPKSDLNQILKNNNIIITLLKLYNFIAELNSELINKALNNENEEKEIWKYYGKEMEIDSYIHKLMHQMNVTKRPFEKIELLQCKTQFQSMIIELYQLYLHLKAIFLDTWVYSFIVDSIGVLSYYYSNKKTTINYRNENALDLENAIEFITIPLQHTILDCIEKIIKRK